jgi:HD-GYP domain-containing protein (c-di-GMP phosphodiesterase class II)
VQSYNRTSDIILSSAEQLYTQLSNEIQLDFKATYQPVGSTLDLLSLSPIVEADTRAARIDNLPRLTAALSGNSGVSGIQLGYPNGDYFIVRPLNSDYLRQRFEAPAGASYVVDEVATSESGMRQLTRSFFDQALALVQENPPAATAYDPRVRPWYRQAEARPRAIPPYLFFFTRKVGTTVTQRTDRPGVVVAADVSLEQLSETVSRYRVTPNSEAVVLGSDGAVLAYQDKAAVVTQQGDASFTIARLAELDSPVLQQFASALDLTPRKLDFEHQGRRWIGSIDKIARNSSLDLSILLVSPVDELLVEATAIRQELLLKTAVTIALIVPIVWLLAGRIAGPMRRLAAEAEAIRRFDFDQPVETRSFISEVDLLADAMRSMKTTINRFLSLINSLAGERELDGLLERITRETMNVAKADAAVTYLLDEDESHLVAGTLYTVGARKAEAATLPDVPVRGEDPLASHLKDKEPSVVEFDGSTAGPLAPLLDLVPGEKARLIVVPLRNRQQQPVGVLGLLYPAAESQEDGDEQGARIAFVNALSGFAAVGIESRHLLKMQRALLDSFIKLIAGAIDAKSPYTGGHCQRVPELTRMLAEAACASADPPFVDFELSDEDWEALHIASWLHDCGKVTTPEYVVDKSTKLETIYDRIHEVRMRFELLKRDAEVDYWREAADGGDRAQLQAELDARLGALDDDFAFVAECNEGGEFMAPERIERLRKIARTTWTRTLDDRIGVSWEERQRKDRTPAPTLPAIERLLADKQEHIIERPDNERMPADNRWGFKLDVPEHKYNRGELYNLEVARGTLSAEERFKINDHVVQTIIMLDKLPYPRHLRAVPEIAGGHHETMQGTGYPKRLTRDETSLPARMMAIADIFEALTASDRPYKKAKSLSEAIRILSFMKNDDHIDPDLFVLFLKSGVWRQYAEKYLAPEQLDDVDIQAYIG